MPIGARGVNVLACAHSLINLYNMCAKLYPDRYSVWKLSHMYDLMTP